MTALTYEEVKNELDKSEANGYLMRGFDSLDIAFELLYKWYRVDGHDTNELIPLIDRWKEENDK